jgi:CheY-like chemotaxis protein
LNRRILKRIGTKWERAMEAAKPRILCLDDQPEILLVRKVLLEQFGCEVVTVTDSSACLHVAAQETFDLALLDLHLAERVTGEDVARDLRILLPKMPLVMLTGDPRIPASARKCVDAVLIKGQSGPGELLDTIHRLLPRLPIRPRRESALPSPISKTS